MKTWFFLDFKVYTGLDLKYDVYGYCAVTIHALVTNRKISVPGQHFKSTLLFPYNFSFFVISARVMSRFGFKMKEGSAWLLAIYRPSFVLKSGGNIFFLMPPILVLLLPDAFTANFLRKKNDAFGV